MLRPEEGHSGGDKTVQQAVAREEGTLGRCLEQALWAAETLEPGRARCLDLWVRLGRLPRLEKEASV